MCDHQASKSLSAFSSRLIVAIHFLHLTVSIFCIEIDIDSAVVFHMTTIARLVCAVWCCQALCAQSVSANAAGKKVNVHDVGTKNWKVSWTPPWVPPWKYSFWLMLYQYIFVPENNFCVGGKWCWCRKESGHGGLGKIIQSLLHRKDVDQFWSIPRAYNTNIGKEDEA